MGANVAIAYGITQQATTHYGYINGTCVAGDKIFVFISKQDIGAGTIAAGWNIPCDDGGIQAQRFYVLEKTAAGGENGYQTVMTTGAAKYSSTATLVVRGWDTTGGFGPVGNSFAITSGSSATPNPPSQGVTSGSTRDALFLAGASRNGSAYAVTAWSTNYTGLVDAGVGSSRIAVESRNNTIATEDPGVITFSGSTGWSAQTFPLRSALAPSAPGTPSLTSINDGSISLSFSGSSSNGGSPVYNYRVYNNYGAYVDFGTATSGTFGGLSNGTAYTFYVYAMNYSATSGASGTSGAGTPYGVPGTPGTPSATSVNDSSVSLSWGAPGNNGSAITTYRVYNNYGTFQDFGTNSGTFTGLSNGTAYTFYVYALNARGWSAASGTSSAYTPYGVPAAPTMGTATPGDTSASITFSANGNGGSAIDQYAINTHDSAGTYLFQTIVYSSPGSVTGLTNGTGYQFYVYAHNARGYSGNSASSGVITPYGVPTAPGTPSITSTGDTAVSLSWAASGANGNAVSNYRITSSPGGVIADVGTATSGTIGGLTNGTSYTFTVNATNARGYGASSAASAATTPYGVPTAPGTPTISTVGDTQVTVAFTAAGANGNAITNYRVTASPGGAFVNTGTSLSGTVTGLTNGTSYTFTVYATNARGNGGSSAASAAAVPYGVPGVPGTPTISTVGDTQVTVAFSAASTNGSTITNYRVTALPSGAFVDTGTSLSGTVTGLTNGTSYTFTATATNARGTGSASGASATAIPYGVPTAPGTPTAVAGDTQASISWAASSSNNGRAITNYRVTSSPGGFFTDTGTTLSGIVTGLTNGTAYTFTVYATNLRGDSASSSASNSVTPVSPISVKIRVIMFDTGMTSM